MTESVSLLEKLGNAPDKSWRTFMQGLVAFWLSAVLVWLSLDFAVIWFYLAVLLLFSAFCYSVWGYIGIFANRWLRLKLHREQYKRAFSDKA
ncbi:hypothetical protein N7931_18825 [Catenovulum sp. 2E275]|uniref:hypothetical protein n=1 Tax=Catenovulum sp. 2E275 TaxID=2980497 RepID=UPI0021D3A423|nr:hypothetical protein [Catenovulum sp. 2E275]MCU4677673.1 hypothetical protein [Catenovulum sp. 2E275]